MRGINSLNEEYRVTYAETGIEDFSPNIPITYWSFRLMMGLGFLAMIVGAWMWWLVRRDRVPAIETKHGKLLLFSAITLPLMPLFANSFGWIFTEMGRQPWAVFGLMPTAAGVSPTVSAAQVWTSVITFTLLYGGLAVVELGLLIKYIRKGLPDANPPVQSEDSDEPLSFAY